MSSAAKIFKRIAFTSAAQEHHITMKTKSVLKWLKSGHEVRVQIQGKADRQKAMEGIFRQIESQVKSGADVKQKVVKPDTIKFSLMPTKEAANFDIDESDLGRDGDIDIDEITSGKDVLSEDFEKELEKSILDEKSKNKRR